MPLFKLFYHWYAVARSTKFMQINEIIRTKFNIISTTRYTHIYVIYIFHFFIFIALRILAS